MMTQPLRFTLAVCSATLFLISLYFPCYSTGPFDADGRWGGLVALLTGWLGLMGDTFNYLSWLANPLLIVALSSALLRKELVWMPVICAGLALFCAASFLSVDEILVDEAGGMGTIQSLLAGYWLWLASCGLLFLSESAFLYNKRRNK